MPLKQSKKDRALIIGSFLKYSIIIIEIVLYLLAFIFFFYFIISTNFEGASKCLIMMFLLLTYRFTQRIFNIKIHSLLKLTVLIFILSAMFLGETLNFYSKIYFFDKFLHLFSGAMLFFLGQVLFKHIEKPQISLQINANLMLLFSMFFSIAMAGCWEIFEFSCDRIMGCHSQQDSLFDTMEDIICGTSTAILAALSSFILSKIKIASIAINHLAGETRNNRLEIMGDHNFPDN